jgi:hypothetical protein
MQVEPGGGIVEPEAADIFDTAQARLRRISLPTGNNKQNRTPEAG